MKKIKLGNCYESSINAIMEIETHGSSDWKLCHGIVTGTEGYAKNIKYGHAWIECNGVVIDVEAGSSCWKKTYYRVGKIGYVKRYNVKQVEENMLESMHCGPWDEKILSADEQARERVKQNGFSL